MNVLNQMPSAKLKYKRVILKVTGEVLAGAQRFGIDGEMVRGFAEEIKEVKELVPPSFGLNFLDLFYWEHRLGAWLGAQYLVEDSFIDGFAPFNCRAVFVNMLGVGVEHRKEPYVLFRKMCEIAYPEVLDEPFNWSKRWKVEQRIWSLIPWRIKNLAARHARGSALADSR